MSNLNGNKIALVISLITLLLTGAVQITVASYWAGSVKTEVQGLSHQVLELKAQIKGTTDNSFTSKDAIEMEKRLNEKIRGVENRVIRLEDKVLGDN
jgi:hypothetical protein